MGDDGLGEDGLAGCANRPVTPAVAGAALVAAVGLARFVAVTAGTFGPGPVFTGADDASLGLFEGAPVFCCSTSARKRSTSARSAFNSSRISCCSVGATELEPAFVEDVPPSWVD